MRSLLKLHKLISSIKGTRIYLDEVIYLNLTKLDKWVQNSKPLYDF